MCASYMLCYMYSVLTYSACYELGRSLIGSVVRDLACNRRVRELSRTCVYSFVWHASQPLSCLTRMRYHYVRTLETGSIVLYVV